MVGLSMASLTATNAGKLNKNQNGTSRFKGYKYETLENTEAGRIDSSSSDENEIEEEEFKTIANANANENGNYLRNITEKIIENQPKSTNTRFTQNKTTVNNNKQNGDNRTVAILELTELPTQQQQFKNRAAIDDTSWHDHGNKTTLWSKICYVFTCGTYLAWSSSFFPGYEHYKNSVTSEQYTELKHAFVAFDRNEDGFIDSEDLGYVMGKLGHDLSNKELKRLFKDICKHRTGKMDFTDFVEMMSQDKLVLTTSEQEILAAFQFLDQNQDGYITVDELLQRFHGCLSDTEASRLMCEADANGDGKIDFEEFKHIMFNQERSISLAQSDGELFT